MDDPQLAGLAAPPSPTSIAQLSSADIDEVRDMLNRFFYPTAVGLPDGAGGFKLSVNVIRLGPMTIGQLHFASPVTLLASELDAYHVTMPLTGRATARQAGREVTADPTSAAIFGPGNPVFTRQEADTEELDVKIEQSALEAELAAMLGHPIRGPLDLPPSIGVVDGLGHRWRHIVQMLHEAAYQPDSLVHQRLIGERVRHLVVSHLLCTLPHRYRDELLAPAKPTAPRAIRRVQEAIESEPERPFSVTDLAMIASVSVRSLQDGFRRHIGDTPMAYLQTIRLQRAHDDLLAADPAGETVSAIAHRWGFAHLGRFASAYRTRYGRSPSETLRS